MVDIGRELKPKEIHWVTRQPEDNIWLVKASTTEILERLKCEDAMLVTLTSLDGVIGYRIDDRPEPRILYVWR